MKMTVKAHYISVKKQGIKMNYQIDGVPEGHIVGR